MSENALSADNQQGSSLLIKSNPSETTRRTPFKSNVLRKSEVYAYLQGAMHDASLNKRKRIRFGQKYPGWLDTLKDLLMSVGANSWTYKEGKSREYYILETVCKDLHFSFNPVALQTKGEKVAYIRGFFDAEGGIPRTRDEFYIQLVQKDFEKMETLKSILIGLGIGCGRIHKEFARIIGSCHPIKAEIFFQRMMI